jgi:nucleoside-diphosphate kinase
MPIERTISLIKPDAVSARKIGEIISVIEKNYFKVLDIKMFRMSREFAENFYCMHRNKHFFSDLIEFMISGHTVALLLERENAVQYLRTIVGDTEPSQAAPGTLRRKYGTDVRRNAVHAADSIENAAREINIIFGESKDTMKESRKAKIQAGE